MVLIFGAFFSFQSSDVFNPDMAESLINPISLSFSPVINSPSSVQLIFPVLLASTILFSSMLFSNIVTANSDFAS